MKTYELKREFCTYEYVLNLIIKRYQQVKKEDTDGRGLSDVCRFNYQESICLIKQ